MIIVMKFILMTSCRNGRTFEIRLSTATLTMETEIVGVVGRLKTMEVPPLSQLDINVGVGTCWNGRRSLVQACHRATGMSSCYMLQACHRATCYRHVIVLHPTGMSLCYMLQACHRASGTSSCYMLQACHHATCYRRVIMLHAPVIMLRR